MKPPEWIIPDWPAPPAVRAVQTTRQGGESRGCYASLNLGDHVGDNPEHVAANRQRVLRLLPAAPLWLEQVHGITVVDVETACGGTAADASVARKPDQVCVVMTADCLPLLLCDRSGTVVAAVHAGWRSLAGGIIEAAVKKMNCPAEQILVWLGPAIGPGYFEVGTEVRAVFVDTEAQASDAFIPASRPNKWLADIYLLARQRLTRVGVHSVFGGNCCTVRDRERFFSYRREGRTGRMGSFIWLASAKSENIDGLSWED